RELAVRLGQVRRVDGVLERALEAGADGGMVEEDAPADVDQERALDERLDVPLLLLRPEPEVAQEVADVAAAEGDEPGDDDQRQAHDRREAPPRGAGAPARDGERGRRRQPEADRTRRRAGEDQPDRAGHGGGGGEPAPPRARKREPDQRDAPRRAREPRQVVVAEERGLTPAGRPAREDPPAEEL